MGIADQTFNSLSLAIMALLHERPMHPYEIAFTMRQRRMEKSIKLNYGSLYHTVELLQRADLITPTETGREGRRPERTVYALTDNGREKFRNSLERLIRQPIKEYNHFEAGLCFLLHLSAEEAVASLRERASKIEEELAKCCESLDSHLKSGLTRLALIEIEHARMIREAELLWINGLANDIEAGGLGWCAHIDQPLVEKETV